MHKKTDYLLKYMSMDTYNNIINNTNSYVLSLLEDNYIDVNLNINFLIKYGITNIEKVIVNMLGEIVMDNNSFAQKILDYESKLTKEEVITLIENM